MTILAGLTIAELDGQLVARIDQAPPRPPLDADTVRAALADAGYADWALRDEALAALLQRWQDEAEAFELEKFLADVKAMHERHGRCVIAVSEGIHDASGQPIAAQLAKELECDAHGNVQLSGNGALADLLCEQIKARLAIKRVRGDTFGYVQRSFVGCVSDVDQREAREVGEKAVQFAMWGHCNGSVAIKRTGYYSADYELVPLDAVAGKTRVMDDAFISASGTDVTDAFRMYLRPLLGSGMPDAFRLRPAPVARVLRP